MAFHLRKISMARTDFRILCKIIILVFIITGSSEGKRQRWGSRREHLSHPCAKCDKRDCKEVTPETCSGIIQKDDCECCPVCVYQSEDQVPEENAEENQFVRPTGIPISKNCFCSSLRHKCRNCGMGTCTYYHTVTLPETLN